MQHKRFRIGTLAPACRPSKTSETTAAGTSALLTETAAQAGKLNPFALYHLLRVVVLTDGYIKQISDKSRQSHSDSTPECNSNYGFRYA